MIKKTIYISAFIFLLMTVSCSKKNNNVTNPILEETEYTVKGIDSKYNAVWKFFNADEKGAKPVDVSISDGAINNLVVSNKSENVSFSKDSIYSCEKEESNIYYQRYFGYIISDGKWVGEIHFPIYDETVGYVYIKNRTTSDIICGIIDKAPGEKNGIDSHFYGTRVNTDKNGLKRTLDINENFVTYSENDQVKVKIPSVFFEGSWGSIGQIDEYTIFQGLLYDGIWIKSHNDNNASILPNLYFLYADYNRKLDIKLRYDNVPISAKYIEKETIISPDNIQYSKR
ncbi:hypothetical protein [Brachyspira innocens]|uniref:hypothetical protein n=1 Tax=Brachyspira innocens TaxID=13264 RepID=UPI0026EB6C84|nr:hypothetical protein [Brachyspira innocens]